MCLFQRLLYDSIKYLKDLIILIMQSFDLKQNVMNELHITGIWDTSMNISNSVIQNQDHAQLIRDYSTFYN